MKPTIGRIVHYRLPQHIVGAESAGELRAAIVTRVWNDTCVNLAVFWDGEMVPVEGLPARVTSVVQGTGDGQWDWPAREPAASGS